MAKTQQFITTPRESTSMANPKDKLNRPPLRLVDEKARTRESWKVFQIMAEFVEGFERLAGIRPSVSIFGSARPSADHEYYVLAEEIARKLSDAGRRLLRSQRGRSGNHGSGQQGRLCRKIAEYRAQHQSAERAGRQRLPGFVAQLPAFFCAQGHVCQTRVGLRGASRGASARWTNWRRSSRWCKRERAEKFPSFW